MTTGVDKDDAIQEEILRAALQLYRKYGPDKVTMDDVANATGRSRSSLYYYYKNRDDIFQAVVDRIAIDLATQLRTAVAGADSISDKIYAFCKAKLKSSSEWKSIFNAMWESMNVDERSKHARQMDSLHIKLVHHESIILGEVMSEAAARGEIKRITAAGQDMMSFIISSGIRGLRREIYDQNDPHDITAAIHMFVDMVVKWLKE